MSERLPTNEPASNAASAPPAGRAAEHAAEACASRRHVIPTGAVFATVLESLNRGASSRLLTDIVQLFELHCAPRADAASEACTLCTVLLSAEIRRRIRDRVEARRAARRSRARRRAARRRTGLLVILVGLGLLLTFLAGLFVGKPGHERARDERTERWI